jgi:hypothetical protein
LGWLGAGLALAALTAIGAWAVWSGWLRRAAPPAVADPRATFDTPYLNVRPEVGYTGDEACVRCHPDLTASYRHHPMSRSLAPVAAALPRERYDPAGHNPLTAGGFVYQVEQRQGRVFHREIRRNSRGEAVTDLATEIHYTVGSGSRARSYLVERDGSLFQSPLTWYSEPQIWDLSPGYDLRNWHFGRPILVECLFCHTNYVEADRSATNRYRPPVFRGYAIGCERCHGPGELHVRRREQNEAVSGVDYTIVNPRDLQPALREAVCQQCHLKGQGRTVRRRREAFDFRPGLPLELFWTTFVKSADSPGAAKTDHVEQMHASRCFQASGGKLGCVSCHNPHAWPQADQRVAYYRGRCLACHQDQGCSLPLAVRKQRSKDDDCTACHMARGPSTTIVHTAVTDHRIPREAAGGAPAAPGGAKPLPSGEIHLVPFHRADHTPGADELARDLGVALMKAGPEFSAEAAARQAAALLAGAVQTWPEDLPAGDALGRALWVEGRREEALAAFQAVLARAPQQEFTLVNAAKAAASLKRLDEAIDYMVRANGINPGVWEHHSNLARLYEETQQWGKAMAECQRALELNPAAVAARQLLRRCYLRRGDTDRAQVEADILKAYGASP